MPEVCCFRRILMVNRRPERELALKRHPNLEIHLAQPRLRQRVHRIPEILRTPPRTQSPPACMDRSRPAIVVSRINFIVPNLFLTQRTAIREDANSGTLLLPIGPRGYTAYQPGLNAGGAVYASTGDQARADAVRGNAAAPRIPAPGNVHRSRIPPAPRTYALIGSSCSLPGSAASGRPQEQPRSPHCGAPRLSNRLGGQVPVVVSADVVPARRELSGDG
jgi:hypothetical protein